MVIDMNEEQAVELFGVDPSELTTRIAPLLADVDHCPECGFDLESANDLRLLHTIDSDGSHAHGLCPDCRALIAGDDLPDNWLDDRQLILSPDSISLSDPDRNRHLSAERKDGDWILHDGSIQGTQMLSPVANVETRERALEETLRWLINPDA